LKKGSAKPLHGGHPWVFAEAIAGFEGGAGVPARPGSFTAGTEAGATPQAGDEVRVVDDRGTCIGRGFYSPASAIAIRIITRADTPIDQSLLESRIDEAIRLRTEVLGLGGAGVPARQEQKWGGLSSLPGSGKQAGQPAPLSEAADADPKLLQRLQELDNQLARVQAFAAQYGMDALEETAELRRRRDVLLKELPPAERTAGVSPASSNAGETPAAQTTAYRLINSEGDGLGGLIVDVYGEYLSVQFGTAGMYRRAAVILDALEKRLHPKAIVDRSDAHTRKIEKLPSPQEAPLRGTAPTAAHTVLEYGIEITCDLRSGRGQKTGLFLDQRENRRRFGELAAGRDVLDVFSYSGGFSLHAACGGAKSVTLIESSADALDLARENLSRVAPASVPAEFLQSEWPEGFKRLREAGRLFQLIVLDPPKFARGKGDVSAALSAYRDLNTQAVRLLAPGGLLFTCSCSGNVSELEFERTVAAGLRASGRRAVLLERRGPGPDHPTPPGFDQGRYLKCLVLQIV
jgi:23S rRNA (cytosine1962-C5)-methyltransferase